MQTWTTAQTAAIQSRGVNLLLSAGAGSGKTAVLTERIVGMVMDGTPLRRMLIVTFTRAAASEMRQRIQGRLEQLAAGEGQARQLARQQLEDFAQAHISTIHSFCQRVLRRHFHEAGLDPAFRIGDEYECALLRKEAIQEVLEEAYAEQETQGGALDALVSGLCDGRETIDVLLGRCYGMMMALPDPWRWLEEAVAAYAQPLEEFRRSALYGDYWQEGIQGLKEAHGCMEELRALAHASSQGPTDKFFAAADASEGQLAALLHALETGDMAAFGSLASPEFPNFRSWNKNKGEGREQAYACNNRAKACFQEYVLGRNYDPVQLWQPMHAMAEPLNILAQLLRRFDVRYAQKKQKKGLIDFVDQEQKTLLVLRSPEIRQEYQQRYDAVFVDEYQDSNRVQEELMDAVGGPGKLFYVGDVKQSIYGFRAADPSLFRRRAESYRAQPARGQRIDLRENFRSAPNVLGAVNDVFARNMERLGGLRYGEEERLLAGKPRAAEQPQPPVRLCLLMPPEKDAPHEQLLEVEEVSSIQRETVLAARMIRQRLHQPLYDGKTGQPRDTEYRDICILLRTARNQAEVVARTLAEEGIPAYTALSGGYFEALEVQVLLDLMRLVDNRRQDLALLSVMRAGIAGFVDADLVELRRRYPKSERYPALIDGFFEACAAYGEGARDRLTVCCQALNALLLDAKERARVLRLDKWMEWLMRQSGYDLMTAALPGGPQRSANLEILLQRAQKYESLSAGGVHGFLRHLDRLKESGRDMGEAVLSGEGSNAVQVMTIHASKGLEFPIVLLLGLGKAINQQDLRRRLLLHRDLGLGARGFEARRRIKHATLRHKVMAERMRQETVAEELRLLYVAMTRAREELILVGGWGKRGISTKRCEKWLEGSADDSLLDFVLNAVIGFPQAAAWRKTLGLTVNEIALPTAHWQIDLIQGGEWRQSAAQREHLHTLRQWEEQARTVESRSVAQHYAWQYPSRRVPGKVTVSALASGRLRFEETPKFLAPSRRTGADIGRAYHAVLERLDWADDLSAAGLKAQVARMLSREILRPEQTELVKLDKLAHFTQGPLGQRMKNAAAQGTLSREMPFTVFMEAGQLPDSPEAAADEKVILQGVIDACFLEDGDWIIVDYKSDRLTDESPEGLEAAAQAHRQQLRLYADALTTLTGRAVREAYIFLISAGEAVRLDI